MTYIKQHPSARFWTRNEALSGINHSLQEVPLNRNYYAGLTLYAAIQFYPHWYPVLPLYWFKTNITRCDWRVKVVIHHGILINVSSKNLWINNIGGFPLNLWKEWILWISVITMWKQSHNSFIHHSFNRFSRGPQYLYNCYWRCVCKTPADDDPKILLFLFKRELYTQEINFTFVMFFPGTV